MVEEESPGHHKKKHLKSVQELWEEIEKREREKTVEVDDTSHQDYEEEVFKESE